MAAVSEANEDQVALDLVDIYGKDLQYVAVWHEWMTFLASHWAPEKTLAVFGMIRKLFHEKGRAKARTSAGAEWLARSDRRVAATIDQWDRDPWLFNTPIGTAELQTWREATP